MKTDNILSQKQIEKLPTTNIIKSLTKYKKLKFVLKSKNDQKEALPKNNLVNEIIYVAQKLNQHDLQSEKNLTQMELRKKENEEFKTDLKMTCEKTELIDSSPKKSCQELINQYKEKNYQIPNLDTNHNLFEANPLIQTEKDIIRFYTNKVNAIGYIPNLDKYKEKNKDYLVRLGSLTNKMKEKGKTIKPEYEPISKKTSKVKESKTSFNATATDAFEAKISLKLQLENNELQNDISSTLETINNLPLSIINYQRKDTTPCYKIFRNKPTALYYNMNSVTPNAFQSINTSTSPDHSPTNNQYKNFPISTLNKKKTIDLAKFRKTLNNPNQSIHRFLTEPSLSDKISRDINAERLSKNGAINELYDFAQKTDYSNFLSCIKQYQKKYHRNKGAYGYNTMGEKTSYDFDRQLCKHFNHVKNIISNSNTRDSCISCYTRIGMKDKLEEKLYQMDKLDYQLSKFNYLYVKKKIINEKSN